MPNPNTAKFPTAIATDVDLPVGTDSFQTTLTSNINNLVTTIPVADTSLNVPAIIKIGTEIIRAQNKSGLNLINCDRGFAGSTAASHSGGDVVNDFIMAWHGNQAFAEIKAIETLLGVGGAGVVKPGDSTKFHIFFKAAITQNAKPTLGFSTSTTNNPTPASYGSNQAMGIAQFANSAQVYDHLVLPEDWVAPIDLEIYWKSAAITGNVVWQIETAGATTGGSTDPTFNAAQTVTTAAQGTTNTLNVSTITGLTTTGLVAGKEFFFRFSRAATDTLASGTADLLSLKFTIRRTLQ